MKSVHVFYLLALALLLAGGGAWAQLPGDVVFSEMMYDDTASTDLEWAEIHNNTAASIDISGWVILDCSVYPGPGTEGQILIPAGTTLAAGQYLVISRLPIPEFTGEVVGTGSGSWTLGNSGDNLALYTAATGGTLIDGSHTVNTPDLAVGNAGNSIERCNLTAPWSGLAADWKECTDVFATAGRYRHISPNAAGTPCSDITPPTITSVTVISNTALDVLFSEPVELVTAETEANYVVSPGSLVPTLATRDGANLRLVHLTFAPIGNGGYTLTANGVQDLALNPCVSATGTFSISNLEGTVRINEVMYDDTAGGDVEWVETSQHHGGRNRRQQLGGDRCRRLPGGGDRRRHPDSGGHDTSGGWLSDTLES